MRDSCTSNGGFSHSPFPFVGSDHDLKMPPGVGCRDVSWICFVVDVVIVVLVVVVVAAAAAAAAAAAGLNRIRSPRVPLQSTGGASTIHGPTIGTLGQGKKSNAAGPSTSGLSSSRGNPGSGASSSLPLLYFVFDSEMYLLRPLNAAEKWVYFCFLLFCSPLFLCPLAQTLFPPPPSSWE